MRFGVVVFPGTNDDRDVEYALNQMATVTVKRIWHAERDLSGLDCIIIPGGFSFGDYLRCGAMAKLSPVMEEVVKFAQRGGYVMGICNGFQVLTEVGLLPGALLRNTCLTFVCEVCELEVINNQTPFTRAFNKGQLIRLPIKHNEGCYYAGWDLVRQLEDNEQIVVRYVANPNGSTNNIAGVCNKSRNVFGMMPHPEHACEELLGGTDGSLFFKSMINLL